jgi:hypothetical protein
VLTKKEKEDLIGFIYSRERPEGGFSFSESTPPTLEDSYFALSLLEELGEHYTSKQTVSYITSLKQRGYTNPKYFYQLASVYRITRLQDRINALYDVIKLGDEIVISTLSDLYYMFLTRLMLHIPITLKKNERDIISSVRLKKVKSMEECKQLVILMKGMRMVFKSEEYIIMIQESQNLDGGFGCVPRSTSFLEHTYNALHGLKELQAAPVNIKQCERFVRSCLANVGGFGRQMTTIPTLEYSYYAFMSLKFIDEMKKQR